MISNLLATLNTASNAVPNPFNLSGYAASSKELNDEHIDEIKLAIKDDYLKGKISVDSINKSKLTSYFTPLFIVRPLFKLVNYLGIHGAMLEPSCGNGRFLVEANKLDLDMTAVELDPVMGLLARSACPSADIRIAQRFEKADLEPQSFSLVISNPPYGNIKPHDSIKNYGNINIMGYFVLKGLEMLHSGGYEVFVLSTWFMDSSIKDGRKIAESLGQLALALRLPDGCFSEEGTGLPVDILIFKRSQIGGVTEELNNLTINATEWVNTKEVIKDGVKFTTNSFFANNPECVLGELVAPDSMFRSCKVLSDLTEKEIETSIVKLGKKYLKKDGFDDIYKQNTIISEYSKDALKYRFNELFWSENCIKQRKESVLDRDGYEIAKINKFKCTKNANELLKSYLILKDAYFSLINAEYNDFVNSDIERYRNDLREQYNCFKNSFGALNKKTNKKHLNSCSQYLRIAGLERDYQPENKEEELKESYSEAQLLTKRVFSKKIAPTSAESPHQALTISIMEYGTLNVHRVASLLNLTEIQAINVLVDNDLAYELPSGGYVSSIEYLNGNVKEKIDELQGQSKFYRNHDALTKCLPKRVISTDISIPLGAIWVPVKIYSDFVSYLFNNESVFKVIRSDRFHVKCIKSSSTFVEYNSIAWGTNDYEAIDLITAILNGKPVTVYVKNANGERFIDNQLTLLAQSKVDEIKTTFQDWIFSDIERRTELEEIYNNTFNVFAKRDLSSISQYLYVDDCAVIPYDYQYEGALFALLNNGSMLDMPTGSGKSLTYMIYLQYLNKIYPNTRAVVVMPNNLVGQFAIEYMSNFPKADIIILDNELPKEKREEILKNAVNNSFDALILPLSTYENLEAPKDAELFVLNELLEQLENSINLNEADNITTYRLENRKETFESRVEDLKHKSNVNQSITFNDLNLTSLLLDEAQSVKNLGFSSSYTGVRGMGSPAGSKVAYDSYIKSQAILKDGGKVVFGTGTTLSNTVLELTTWFRMLAPELKNTGLHNIDEFITMFSLPETSFSIDSTGRGFKQYTSLSTFTNIPELANLYSTFAYTMSKEELDTRIPLLPDGRKRIPPIKNGKINTVVLDISPEQDEIFKVLVKDAGNITKKRNMLAIMHDAKCASLDQRLFNPSLPESSNNVINTAVKNIVEIHNKHSSKGISSNQIVFCDKGIPNRHRASEKKFISNLVKSAKNGDLDAIAIIGEKTKEELIAGLGTSFSVYDELERKLKNAGLRVAVIHDHSKTRASRTKLQQEFNMGHYDVLIGSSCRLGTGWNVNRLLVASHDLDLPMTPGELTQRWGRIDRQGNFLYEQRLIEHVEMFMYTTKKTLDAWSVDLLDRKSKQFASFAKTRDVRIIEPVEDVISLEELTAIVADNSLMLERVKLAHDIRLINAQKRAFLYKKNGYQKKWQDMQQQMPIAFKRMAEHKADLAILAERPEQYFTDTLGNELDFRELNKKLNAVQSRNVSMVTIAKSQDFMIKISFSIWGLTAYVVGNANYQISFKGKSKAILEQAISVLRNVESFDNKQFQKICAIHKETRKVKAEINKIFDDESLPEKMSRLKEIDFELLKV